MQAYYWTGCLVNKRRWIKIRVRCLTNNPYVISKNIAIIEPVNGSTLELFMHTRQELLKGFRLITHPLTGSIGPDKNPYKSIVISADRGSIEQESLRVIENSIDYTKNLTLYNSNYKWDKASLEDYQIIDYEFVKSFLA